MSNVRQSRVQELLKRQLGEVIRRELNVTEYGLITVNEILMGGDLKTATVYVSILGNKDQQKRGFEKLVASRARIQELMAHGITLKYTPVLRFVTDDSLLRGNKVLALLDEIEKTLPPADPAAPAKPAPEQK